MTAELDSIIASNREAYDAVADEYKHQIPAFSVNNEQIIRRTADTYKRVSAGEQPHRVLDVGVGSGLDLKVFDLLGFETHGIDISQKMLEVASQTSPHSHMYHGNFLSFSFPQPFDIVYAQAFIHLFPAEHTQQIFAKFSEIMSDDGLLHIGNTIHERSSEGYEHKKDFSSVARRYRRRFTRSELDTVVRELDMFTVVDEYDNHDPKGKLWRNISLQHHSS